MTACAALRPLSDEALRRAYQARVRAGGLPARVCACVCTRACVVYQAGHVGVDVEGYVDREELRGVGPSLGESTTVLHARIREREIS